MVDIVELNETLCRIFQIDKIIKRLTQITIIQTVEFCWRLLFLKNRIAIEDEYLYDTCS